MKRFLIISNLVLSLLAGIYLLRIKSLPPEDLIYFQPEVVLQLLSFIGLLSGNMLLLYFILPFLFYYGTMGLFFQVWEGEFFLFQLEHLLMTASCAYIFVSAIIRFHILNLGIGIVAGTFLLIVFVSFYQLEVVSGQKDYQRYVPQLRYGTRLNIRD